MRYPDFLTEQWMTKYERQARYNLTATDGQSVTLKKLQSMEPDLFEDLVLDYGWISGDPRLRQEILNQYSDRREETLTLCHGALTGNEMVMAAIVKPGDHVISFVPGYQQFSEVPRFHGADVSEVSFTPDDWSVDFDQLEQALTNKTVLIAFASPSNPTGTFLQQDDQKKMVEFARRHDLWILCDEVYRDPQSGVPSFSDLYEKAVTVSSLSKFYGQPGLRLGWIKGNPEIVHAIDVGRDYTFISTGPVADALALCVMRHRDEILAENRAIVQTNKDILSRWLQSTPHFSCVLPKQGTVCFLKVHGVLDTETLARALLEEEGIFFVPGECFGFPGYFRLGLGHRQDNLPEVLARLDKAVSAFKEANPQACALQPRKSRR